MFYVYLPYCVLIQYKREYIMCVGKSFYIKYILIYLNIYNILFYKKLVSKKDNLVYDTFLRYSLCHHLEEVNGPL